MKNNDFLRQTISHVQATAFANEAMMASVIDRIDVLSLNNGSELAEGDSTDDSQPTLSGRAPANSNLLIRDNGTVIGLVQANAEGKWRFTPEKDLESGEHAFQVQGADDAAQKSAAWHLNVLSGEQQALAHAVLPEYTEQTPDVQSVETPATEVSAELPLVDKLPLTNEETVKTTVYETVETSGQQVSDEQSATHPLTDDVVLNPTHTPGIRGFSHDEKSIVHDDTSTPATEELRPLFSGQAEPGSAVDIFDNGIAMGTTFADESGSWEFVPFDDLSVGSHALVAKVNGVSSESFEFEVLLPQPSVTLQLSDLLIDDGQMLVPQILPMVDEEPLTLHITAEDMAWETPYGMMHEQWNTESVALMTGGEDHVNSVYAQ